MGYTERRFELGPSYFFHFFRFLCWLDMLALGGRPSCSMSDKQLLIVHKLQCSPRAPPRLHAGARDPDSHP